MSPTPTALTAIALLAAASSSLFLAGCGEGVVNDPTITAAPPASDVTTSPAPAIPSPAPPSPAPPSPSPVVPPTLPATTPAPVLPPATTPAPVPPPATTTAETCPDLPEGACQTSATHGCLDGEAFEFAKRFACGAKQAPYTRPALYEWATSSCGGQGITFNPSNSFFCFDGVHDFAAGECRDWSPDAEDSSSECRCYGSESSALGAEAAVASAEATESAPVHTLSTTPSCPCSGGTSTSGCLNGHLYEFSTEMPCGNYIANLETHGCCPTAEGIKPYSLTRESCCKDGDDTVIIGHGHACQCRQYGCGESIFSTVI